jgi:hypothetical protein
MLTLSFDCLLCAVDAAGDQPRDGQQNEGDGQTWRRGEISGPPLRIELGFVLIEAFEIVELFAQIEDGRSDLVPQRSEPTTLQSGQRRHAEVEPLISMIPAPQHQLCEQEIHDAARARRVIAHQVDRQLFPALELPQIGECRDRTIGRHDHGGSGSFDIGFIEEAQRETLFLRLLVREPEVRDVPEARHACGDFGQIENLERKALLAEPVVAVAQVLPPPALKREA